MVLLQIEGPQDMAVYGSTNMVELFYDFPGSIYSAKKE
jgi:hypothetical protein